MSKLIKGSGVLFRHTPADYHYSWHTAPRRQFIVNLDADVEIEVSSGERKIICKGEVFFVEDTTGILLLWDKARVSWSIVNSYLCMIKGILSHKVARRACNFMMAKCKKLLKIAAYQMNAHVLLLYVI